MSMYILEPEVAGQCGEHTLYENIEAVKAKKERPIISHLHYEFDGWLGDEILESIANYIITENLAKGLIASDLKGYNLSEVEISKSEEFMDMSPDLELPNFKRFIPLGKIILENKKYNHWSGDDFCLSQNNKLVVSKKALEVLGKYNLSHCDITTINE